MLYKTHKLRIYPNRQQTLLLQEIEKDCKALCNWALTQLYKASKTKGTSEMSYYDLSAVLQQFVTQPGNEHLHAIPQVFRHASCMYAYNLWVASKRDIKIAREQLNTCMGTDSCKLTLSSKCISFKDGLPRLPKLKTLKTAEPPKYQTNIPGFSILREGSKWYLLISGETSYKVSDQANNKSVAGVDVGITTAAVCSDGSVFNLPDTRGLEDKLLFYEKTLNNCVPGSKNYNKTLKKKQAIAFRISNIKTDAIHKYTTALSKKHGVIAIESIHLKALARSAITQSLKDKIYHSAISLIHNQLFQKAKRLVRIGKNFPSSGLCSECGAFNSMPLTERTYYCKECGLVMDRDLNAAINLANEASRQGMSAVCCEARKG